MAKANGVDSKCALVLVPGNGTWGTALAAAAEDEILLNEISGLDADDEMLEDESFGEEDQTYIDLGNQTAEPSIMSLARYGDLDRFLALGMGGSSSPTYTTPSDSGTADSGGANTLTDTGNFTGDTWADYFVTITGGTGVGQTRRITSHTDDTLTVDANWATNPDGTSTYEISGAISTHVYTLESNIDAYWYCLAFWNGVAMVELPSLKPSGFTLRGEMGGYLEIELPCMSNKTEYASAVNTATTNWTNTRNLKRIVMSQGVIRANAQAGAALQASDALTINSFELTVNQPKSGDRDLTNGRYIGEPTKAGMREVTLTLNFPSHSAMTWFTDKDSENEKKLDMIWTGYLLGGATYAQLKFEMPRVKITKPEANPTKEINPLSVTLKGMLATAAPTGMTVTDVLTATLVNGWGGDPKQPGNR